MNLKNCDEVLKEEIDEVIHDSSLNENHDCNDVIMNSINVNCVNNMQNPILGVRPSSVGAIPKSLMMANKG